MCKRKKQRVWTTKPLPTASCSDTTCTVGASWPACRRKCAKCGRQTLTKTPSRMRSQRYSSATRSKLTIAPSRSRVLSWSQAAKTMRPRLLSPTRWRLQNWTSRMNMLQQMSMRPKETLISEKYEPYCFLTDNWRSELSARSRNGGIIWKWFAFNFISLCVIVATQLLVRSHSSLKIFHEVLVWMGTLFKTIGTQTTSFT